MEYRGPHPRCPHLGRSPWWPAAVTLVWCLLPFPVQAEIKIVGAEGEHILGQHDTKDEAIRLATEAAKRDALEQVATYLESVTVSTDLDLTHDEIRTYTAGVVSVIDEHLSITAEGDVVTFHVDLTAQIDTDEVADAVKQLRQHEEVRQELEALRAEVDQLHQDLEQANRALTAGLPSDQAKELADRRTELLNQMQSDYLVQQAWTEWMIGGPYAWPYGYGFPQGVSVPGLLAWAGRLYPTNPHVPVVTHIITTRTGAPLPPAPPAPPAPPGYAGAMPPHQQSVTSPPLPDDAVIGSAPGGHRVRRLQSMLPRYGTNHGAGSSSMFIQTHPGSNPNVSPPLPTTSSQRLRQFLAPPVYVLPPTTRAVPQPASPPLPRWLPSVSTTPPIYHPAPQSSRSFSRLPQSRHPGYAHRPSTGTAPSGGGRGASGGRGR